MTALSMKCGHCGGEHEDGTAICPVTWEPTSLPGPCGRVIDRYELVSLIGKGAFGSVFRARHTVTSQWVAFKLLAQETLSSAESTARLVREARVASNLGHPGIVRVQDCGTTPSGDAFLVMDLVPGRSLDALVQPGEPWPMPRALDVVRQILDALQAAHARGIVHRDVKPANVLVVHESGRDRVVLVDFGICKLRTTEDRTITTPGTAMGTPGFMAPEQLTNARDADARADVYAVGVIAFRLFTGEWASDVKKARRSLRDAVASVAGPAIALVLDRAMAHDPDGRWNTAAEFAAQLQLASLGDASDSLREFATPTEPRIRVPTSRPPPRA